MLIALSKLSPIKVFPLLIGLLPSWTRCVMSLSLIWRYSSVGFSKNICIVMLKYSNRTHTYINYSYKTLRSLVVKMYCKYILYSPILLVAKWCSVWSIPQTQVVCVTFWHNVVWLSDDPSQGKLPAEEWRSSASRGYYPEANIMSSPWTFWRSEYSGINPCHLYSKYIALLLKRYCFNP